MLWLRSRLPLVHVALRWTCWWCTASVLCSCFDNGETCSACCAEEACYFIWLRSRLPLVHVALRWTCWWCTASVLCSCFDNGETCSACCAEEACYFIYECPGRKQFVGARLSKVKINKIKIMVKLWIARIIIDVFALWFRSFEVVMFGSVTSSN